MGHHQDAPAQRSEIVGAAAAGQSDLWPSVIAADHGGIEIAVRVYLRAAEKRIVNETALAGLHHVRHARGHEAAVKRA